MDARTGADRAGHLRPDDRAAVTGRDYTLLLQLLPYVPVVGALVLVFWRAGEWQPYFLVTAGLLLVVVMTRQVMIVYENVSLTRDLEGKVASRTAELTTLGSIVTSSTDAIVGHHAGQPDHRLEPGRRDTSTAAGPVRSWTSPPTSCSTAPAPPPGAARAGGPWRPARGLRDRLDTARRHGRPRGHDGVADGRERRASRASRSSPRTSPSGAARPRRWSRPARTRWRRPGSSRSSWPP